MKKRLFKSLMKIKLFREAFSKCSYKKNKLKKIKKFKKCINTLSDMFNAIVTHFSRQSYLSTYFF